MRQVVITHLHTDHAGGLSHVTGSRVWVTRGEFDRATGFGGRVLGYLPHRWPKWWRPEFIQFERRALGPFDQSMWLTKRGDALIVPTPGHTPHHVSVVVQGDVSFFLAGDTSYNQTLLLAGKVDGVSPDPRVTERTHERIVGLAAERPLVYLPSHDPDSKRRLIERAAIDVRSQLRASSTSRRSAREARALRTSCGDHGDVASGRGVPRR